MTDMSGLGKSSVAWISEKGPALQCDPDVNVNVNIDLYSASSQKAPLMRSMCSSTDQKDTSSVYDEKMTLNGLESALAVC